ncbi:MAG: ATP:cob(I)alamin adenosyltransferase, partial [[Clostridium] fimetarium]|nr:ATP:cob(I)alamin adenosyltransferase [[Clostridium] fimetarium]
MKIYTRTGDRGATSLVGGKRVSKASERLEAYGTIDELNSHIGLLRAAPGLPPEADSLLEYVQNKLFNIGAYLATDNSADPELSPAGLPPEAAARLEEAMDRADEELPPL